MDWHGHNVQCSVLRPFACRTFSSLRVERFILCFQQLCDHKFDQWSFKLSGDVATQADVPTSIHLSGTDRSLSWNTFSSRSLGLRKPCISPFKWLYLRLPPTTSIVCQRSASAKCSDWFVSSNTLVQCCWLPQCTFQMYEPWSVHRLHIASVLHSSNKLPKQAADGPMAFFHRGRPWFKCGQPLARAIMSVGTTLRSCSIYHSSSSGRLSHAIFKLML